MIKMPDYEATVQLDCIGEETKNRWTGTFRIKRVLTHLDKFRLERIYTELIPKDSDANNDLKTFAATIAELEVTVLSGPDWYETSGKGRYLVDRNPLYELYFKCHEASEQWKKEVAERAANAPVTSGD